jgi:hypothetical protein
MECCHQLEALIEDPDVPASFNPKLREWSLKWLNVERSDEGLAVSDWRSVNTAFGIDFCPFCGHQFPPSLRSEFFDILEGLGVDPWHDQLADEFQTKRWWKERGL